MLIVISVYDSFIVLHDQPITAARNDPIVIARFCGAQTKTKGLNYDIETLSNVGGKSKHNS